MSLTDAIFLSWAFQKASVLKLDQTDLTILFHLSYNGRMSLTALGELLNLSPAAVKKRLAKLQDKEIITGFTATINPDLLSPNYVRYLVRLQAKEADTAIQKMRDSTLFETILEVADERNITAITIPISSSDLKSLMFLIDSLHLSNLVVTPILKHSKGTSKPMIKAENATSIYCPQCQTSIEGTTAILTQVGSQVMAFCCEECRHDFVEHYTRIVVEGE